MENVAQQPTVEVPTEATETKEEEKYTVKRQYFSSGRMPEAVEALTKIQSDCSERGIQIINDIPESGPETGFGIGIVPVVQRDEKRGNKIIAVQFGVIPDVETVSTHEKGGGWISDLIQRALLNKLAQATKVEDGSVNISTFPRTVEEFIISSRGDALTTWNELAKDVTAYLRKKGLAKLTSTKLRQVLESTEVAKQYYPKVEQEKWVYVLDHLVELAKHKGLDPNIFIHWTNTRDEKAVDFGNFELDALDGLV